MRLLQISTYCTSCLFRLYKCLLVWISSPFFCDKIFLLSFNAGKEQADFYEQIPIILRELLYRLNDSVKEVLKANHQALGALTKHVPAEALVEHIDFIRNQIASMVSDARRRKGGVGDGEFLLPGLNIPKGEKITQLSTAVEFFAKIIILVVDMTGDITEK